MKRASREPKWQEKLLISLFVVVIIIIFMLNRHIGVAAHRRGRCSRVGYGMLVGREVRPDSNSSRGHTEEGSPFILHWVRTRDEQSLAFSSVFEWERRCVSE